MNRAKGVLVLAIMVVVFAHLLLALVRPLVPLLIVAIVLTGVYSFFFKRKW